MPPDLSAAIDEMIAKQMPTASRPEAIRYALRDWLTGLGYLPSFDDAKDAN